MAFKRMVFLVALIALLVMPLVSLLAAGNMQTTSFKEVDTLFTNPGQGWMGWRFHGSVEYYRFNWVDIEPEKGTYNWKPIDDRLARLQKSGGSLSLRVMTASAHSSGYYSSPKWLFDHGCKGYEYNVGGGDPTSGGKAITRIEPEYADPIYLAEHSAFIAALGKRYDGHPNMEFLDIGSYGIWGEWHTKHPASLAVRKQIVDMYVQAFRKTQLVFMTDDQEGLSYALANGAGLRRDGVGSPWHEQNWIGSEKYANIPDMGNVWKKAPVVFEWFGDYDYLKSKNWSFDAAVNFMVSNHVSMINDNIGNVPPEAMPQLEKLARLAGYRFVLREITHEKTILPEGALTMKMKWANVGVAKLYRSCKLQIALRNSSDQTVATVITDADPRDWLPGEREITSTMRIPNVPSGTYTLAVAITDSANQRPPLKLAMDAPEKEGWYRVGSIIMGLVSRH